MDERRRERSRSRSPINRERRRAGSPDVHHSRHHRREQSRRDPDDRGRRNPQQSRDRRVRGSRWGPTADEPTHAVPSTNPQRSSEDRVERRRDDRPRNQERGRGRADPAHSVEEGKEPWGKQDPGATADGEEGDGEQKPKEMANFEQSGLLFSDANTFKGVVIQHVEPEEARKPKLRWRLYPFKGKEQLPIIYIHRQSCFLIGRDNNVCDIPALHPSISKQHAGLCVCV